MAKRILLLTQLPRPLLPRAVMESPPLQIVRAVMERAPPRPRSQRVAHRSQMAAAHPAAATVNGRAVAMTFVSMLPKIGVPIHPLLQVLVVTVMMNYARMLATESTAVITVIRSLFVISWDVIR